MPAQSIKSEPCKDESKYIAKNLQLLLENNKISINKIAQDLSIPIMTIRRLLYGETTDPRISTLKLIADYFGMTIDYLTSAHNQLIINNSNRIKPYFVPILTWEIVGTMNTINDLDLSNWEDWQPVSLKDNNTIGENAFALKSRPSMYPRFPQGTVFIFDPSLIPTDGDIILIRIKEDNEVTIRELTIDPPEWQLHSVAAGVNVLNYSKENHKIIGVNTLTILYNR